MIQDEELIILTLDAYLEEEEEKQGKGVSSAPHSFV